MKSEIRNTEQWGKVLWLSNDTVEIGVALDFGIRIVHLSCLGKENLYYVQPNDLSDNFTSGDWRLYGGHRYWMAPESTDSYCPDNAPISYELEENGVLITQNPDPVLQIRKRIRITFLEDGGVALDHSVENLSDKTVTGASWGVNTLDGGGVAKINFSCGVRGGFRPKRTVSLWSDTNLHDPRVKFEKDSLTATHMADVPGYFKIGLYVQPGEAVFTNKGQQFTLGFDVAPMEACPDGGCNFELYMCTRFMELEVLGVQTEIAPGKTAEHREIWHLQKA